MNVCTGIVTAILVVSLIVVLLTLKADVQPTLTGTGSTHEPKMWPRVLRICLFGVYVYAAQYISKLSKQRTYILSSQMVIRSMSLATESERRGL